MSFHSSKLMLTAVVTCVCAVAAMPVDAGCHGRSCSSGYSSYGSYSRVVYSQPSYPQPVYSQPVYSQPTYPVQPSNPFPQQVPVQQANPFQQQVPVQQANPFQQPAPQQGLQNNQGLPAAQGTAASQGFSNAQAPQIAGQPQTAFNGMAAPAPVTAQPMTPQVPNGGNPASASMNTAQQSALQALGGFAPPQAAATDASAAQVQANIRAPQPSFAGNWNASLANGARIQLILQADGNFSWTAINKDGQASTFQGIYAVANDSLSLTRSNDNQTLTGSMTTTGANTFTFQLSVAQSATLNFVRS